MARQRFIHPSIWVSDNFVELSFRQRLLFIGMFSLADDEGRIKAKPLHLKVSIFPSDNISLEEIQQDLTALNNNGSIVLYTTEAGQTAYFPKWSSFQKPRFPSPSKIAPPPSVEEKKDYGNATVELPKDYGNITETLQEDYTTGRVGLGRDGMGRVESGSVGSGLSEEKTTTAILNSEPSPIPAEEEGKTEEQKKEASAVEEIGKYYSTLTKRMVLAKDYVSITEVINSSEFPYSLPDRIRKIKFSMAAVAGRKVNEMDTIKSFSYFVPAIKEAFKKELVLKNGGNGSSKVPVDNILPAGLKSAELEPWMVVEEQIEKEVEKCKN